MRISPTQFVSIFSLFLLIFVALSSARRPKAFTRTKYTSVDTHRSQHKSKLFHEVKRPNKHIKMRKTNRRLVQTERQVKYSAKFIPSSKEEENGRKNGHEADDLEEREKEVPKWANE
ncbi:hypothetical protein niasHT_039425 [Heterodera trifolii]|uniref:Transmembrane protein n=1 Tax=Heterodera trifolii TaxID=157864 RepID=A0ABD2J838_9BILA